MAWLTRIKDSLLKKIKKKYPKKILNLQKKLDLKKKLKAKNQK